MDRGHFISAKDLLITDKNGNGVEVFLNKEKINGVIGFDLSCHGPTTILKLEIDFDLDASIEVQL